MTGEFQSTNVFIAAVVWLNALLGGTLAIVIATVAIASVGLLLLSGRIDVRRAAQVVIGCFILFGDSTIASGITALMTGAGSAPVTTAPPTAPTYVAPTKTPAPAYDPYAGAALPPSR